MIPQAYITNWRSKAPWRNENQVEQDMVIVRSLIEIFNDDLLQEQLAFRGGTALHKLFAQPAARYSEDIDLVQITAGPIGDILDRLRQKLNFFEKINVESGTMNSRMVFRYNSEGQPSVRMRLKVEINCREHFTLFGHHSVPLKMTSDWYTGETSINTFSLNELLATKLRALYQRNKGRDLFDLWYFLTYQKTDSKAIVEGFRAYLGQEGLKVSSREFLENMENKIRNSEFESDTQDLLHPEVEYNFEDAYQIISEALLEKV